MEILGLLCHMWEPHGYDFGRERISNGHAVDVWVRIVDAKPWVLRLSHVRKVFKLLIHIWLIDGSTWINPLEVE